MIPNLLTDAGLFKKGWLHPNKSANVIGVYLAKNCDLKNSEKGASFGSIRASFGQHSDRFHGTQIACCLTTDANGYFVPCRNSDCNFCRIFRESFRIDKASAGGMFGAGIYSSSCSSKADNYSRNHHIRTTIHAVIICRVVLGRKQLLKTEDRNRKAPDNGFLSVEAVTKKNGGSVEYPESITYWEDCVIPVGFILYERSGWDGGR
ncbi:hypothetical protein QBC44DRAFT_253835 [Cladorrhinum sp. PSN332]|nr:hypothetical protein QBC44DRAFT_253835 [Cladorrhinum sp. PSN332]